MHFNMLFYVNNAQSINKHCRVPLNQASPKFVISITITVSQGMHKPRPHVLEITTKYYRRPLAWASPKFVISAPRMLSKAWEQWQWQYAELMRQKMLIKRGLMRLMQRKMAAAFGKWRLVTDYLLRLFEKMGRRWRNRSIFAAFNKWRSMLVPPAPPGTPKPVCFSFPDLPAPLPAPRSNQFLGLEAEGCLVSQYFPATSRHHHNTVNIS